MIRLFLALSAFAIAGCNDLRTPGPVPGIPPLRQPDEADYDIGRLGPCEASITVDDGENSGPRRVRPIRRWIRR